MHTIPDANPNQYGMAESIVCSRARDFAGTYYSTFTGMLCFDDRNPFFVL